MPTTHLPKIKSGAPSFSYDDSESVGEGSGIEILVVDDSNVMLQILKAALRPVSGIRVTAFEDPFGAYSHLLDNMGDVGLVITDFRMPEMNGRELAEAIHAVDDSLPVVCISGYDLDDVDTAPFVDHMKKPFDPGKLQHSVMRNLRLHSSKKPLPPDFFYRP